MKTNKNPYRITKLAEKAVRLKLLQAMVLLLLGSFSVSCVSLNSHQTGKTLGKNNYSATGNLNFGYIDAEQYYLFLDSSAFVIGEAGFTGGVSENLDIGIRINTATQIIGTAKYQFIGDKRSNLAASFGLNLGVAPLGVVAGVIGYNYSAALFTSYHPTDNLAITFTPRYTYMGFTNFTEEFGFTREHTFLGYSAGVIVGTKRQVSFELSQFTVSEPFEINTRPIFSVGFIYNFTLKK